MGTPHYMSPEQARGTISDSRTDIFGLGVVLYEMLSGRQAFHGATAVEVMNSILNEEPAELPSEIPPQLQKIVRRCLEKHPENRFQSAGDLAFVLRAAVKGSRPGIEPQVRAAWPDVSRRWRRLIPAAVALLIFFMSVLLFQQRETSWRNPLEGAQFSKLTDFDGAETNAAISPDGKFVVFLSDRDGQFDAWVTQVGSGQFMNLTQGRFAGLVNENVQSVGFSADGANVWVRAHDGEGGTDIWLFPALGGGAPRLFLPRGVHAAWSQDGTRLLYSEAGGGDPLFVADRDGSNPKQIFVDQIGSHAHFPTWSLDGRFIYLVRGVVEQYASISATADGRRLVATVTNSTASLWRLPIMDRPAEESEAERLALPNVRAIRPRYGPEYYLYLSSQNGPGSLWKFETGEASELWRTGENGWISSPAVSHDGRQIAFTLRKQGRGSLYLMRADGTAVRSLESLDVSGVPSWSADGKWIAVIADRGKGPRLFKVPVDPGAPVQLSDELAWNPVWSPDGRVIVYSGAQIRSRAQLIAVNPEGKRIPFRKPIWILPMDERYRFTPDGKALVIMKGDWRMHQFFLLDLDTFQERALSNLRLGYSMRSFDISPDGKYILFDRVRDESDIVLIDLKR